MSYIVKVYTYYLYTSLAHASCAQRAWKQCRALCRVALLYLFIAFVLIVIIVCAILLLLVYCVSSVRV